MRRGSNHGWSPCPRPTDFVSAGYCEEIQPDERHVIDLESSEFYVAAETETIT